MIQRIQQDAVKELIEFIRSIPYGHTRVCDFNLYGDDPITDYEKWIQETVRPHVSHFFMEFVSKRRALHLAARYLTIKGFVIQILWDGTYVLLKKSEELGRLPPLKIGKDFMSKQQNEDVVTGIVRTYKIGSDCEFNICTREEWEAMTAEQQQKALEEALWDSGILEIFPDNAEFTK